MDRYVPLPPLPPRLARLNDLASDLWWSWNAAAREVFRDLDYPLWRFTDHNPVLLLHLIEPDRLAHAAEDADFLRLYDAVLTALDNVRSGEGTWWSRHAAGAEPIAIVCPEFALHQSLPIDTAGLGVIAGDVCKEASDLGAPMIGVGLMYRRGYMHQRLSGEGWQQESYEYLDWSDAPIGPALEPDGSRCIFPIQLAGGTVQIQVWQVRAGRVRLYLLDTDMPANAAWDRELSSPAFDADLEARVRRNVLLGAGAPRALTRLGIVPRIWHVHEAASAFVAFERMEALLRDGVMFEHTLARIRQSTVYDTRVAAPPPSDHVPFALIERHAAACWPELSEQRREILALGGLDTDRGAFFNGAALGARTAKTINAPENPNDKDAWRSLQPAAASRSSIAPGVHLPSWISRDLAVIIEQYLGEDWRDHQDEPDWWLQIADVPNVALWQARQRLRGYLVDFTRERARRRWTREQSSGARLVALGTLLDHATLTIGFARRFTSDVRADVIFHDVNRLAAILTASRRPVQIIMAGKAAAGDETGKHHIQRAFRHGLDPAFGGRVAYLEDYDLHAARLLVQGCDVWLGTPAHGLHLGALKASVNGGLVLDTGEGMTEAAAARAIYRRLEDEIVPAFYDRDRSGVPTRWMAMVKHTLQASIPRACARRAVKAAAEQLYSSAFQRVVGL